MWVCSLFGHVATITELENMAMLEVVLFITAFHLVKKGKLFLVSSCINMLLVQRNEKGLILALCDSQELILWY